MKDFTLNAYKQYLMALIDAGYLFLPMCEYVQMRSSNNDKVVLLRHDVDRAPRRALAMAQVEKELGVRASYYFRAKRCSFDPKIIRAVLSLGHEIGHHYEELSDTSGNHDEALRLFEANIGKLRTLAPVHTVCMHGRPLSGFDNREMFKSEAGKSLLSRLGILAELYLDIDYQHIAYVSDTGRSWRKDSSNIRDHVASDIEVDFRAGADLLRYFRSGEASRICFQVHPERWVESYPLWLLQLIRDSGINAIKAFIKAVR